MEQLEQLVEKVEEKNSQVANKMTIVDGSTLEGTTQEEQRARVALNTVHRACQLMRHL